MKIYGSTIIDIYFKLKCTNLNKSQIHRIKGIYILNAPDESNLWQVVYDFVNTFQEELFSFQIIEERNSTTSV